MIIEHDAFLLKLVIHVREGVRLKIRKAVVYFIFLTNINILGENWALDR